MIKENSNLPHHKESLQIIYHLEVADRKVSSKKCLTLGLHEENGSNKNVSSKKKCLTLGLHDDDVFHWGATPDGSFTTKSAYLTQLSPQSIYTGRKFETIWKWKGPERVRTFLWKLGHEVVLTNVERCRRKMATSRICPLCNDGDGTLLHRFRDCSVSFVIWYGIMVQNHNQFFNNNSWFNWLITNLKTKRNKIENDYWSIRFGIVLDVIWRNMNDFVFKQKTHSTHASIMVINHTFEAVCNSVRHQTSLIPQVHLSIESNSDLWTPPLQGVWSLNCDASVSSSGSDASCGGVLRDYRGEFCFAFAHRLHPCRVLEAELRRILHGITIAWSKGFRFLEINSDSAEAIEVLIGLREAEEEIQGLVEQILEIGDGELMVNWKKVRRCSNSVADRLAHYGNNCNGNMVIFDSIPDFLVNSIHYDGIGLNGSNIR